MTRKPRTPYSRFLGQPYLMPAVAEVLRMAEGSVTGPQPGVKTWTAPWDHLPGPIIELVTPEENISGKRPDAPRRP